MMDTLKRIGSPRWPIRWHMIWTARQVSKTSRTTSKKQTYTHQQSQKPWAPNLSLTRKRASELPINLWPSSKNQSKDSRDAKNWSRWLQTRCPTSTHSIAHPPDAETHLHSSSNTEERRLRPLLPLVKGGKQACRKHPIPPAITHSTSENEETKMKGRVE